MVIFGGKRNIVKNHTQIVRDLGKIKNSFRSVNQNELGNPPACLKAYKNKIRKNLLIDDNFYEGTVKLAVGLYF